MVRRRMASIAKMNVGELMAIDIHTHAEVSTRMLPDGADKEALEARGRYFRYKVQHPTIAQMAAYYRQRKMAFVVFTVDHERGMGIQRISNEEVAESAAEHADVAIPFASIDPARGRMGVREARRLIEKFGVKGFKFHPTVQAFYPNDRDCYPLYEAIAEAGVPALFHTGQTGVGAQTRGGSGIRLKYSNPMHLDDVAADFPDLQIVMAHPAWPWQDEQLAVAMHKPNTWIDLSGWSPRRFAPDLVRNIKGQLQDRVLFGTDYPFLTHDQWLGAWATLDVPEDVTEKVLLRNAERLLGL